MSSEKDKETKHRRDAQFVFAVTARKHVVWTKVTSGKMKKGLRRARAWPRSPGCCSTETPETVF